MLAAASLTSDQNLDLIGLTLGTLVVCLVFVIIRAAITLRTPEANTEGAKAEDANAEGADAKESRAGKIKLTSRMGQGQWDFSQSFATNIAIIGSVLTLILTSGAVPSTTNVLPFNTYSGLAVFFGSLVIVAPLLYNGTAKRVPVSADEVDTAAEYHGTVWGFLLAALLTEWGLVGSVATVFVTLLELYYADSLSVLPLTLMAIVLFASLIFFARYSWVKIDGTIADQLDPEHKAERFARSTTVRAAYNLPAPTEEKPPPSPHWTLL